MKIMKIMIELILVHMKIIIIFNILRFELIIVKYYKFN